VILDGCSHTAHVEQPERYVELLDGFFSRVESTRP
jgi:pimeloyl-ACP methyl ester carboxylesterase